MNRKLRNIPAFFLTLRDTINSNHTVANIETPLQSLFKIPKFTSYKNPISKPFFSAKFSSARENHSDSELILDNEVSTDPSHDSKTILYILSTSVPQEKTKKLDQLRLNLTPGLVSDVISRTRNDWEKAFTFFSWCSNQPGYNHSYGEYHSMIAILGKFRKFDTAWKLIDEMHSASILTPHTLLIMIWRYSAAHDVAKAINAFYAHKRFKFDIKIDQFHDLLSALCRYKNVKDAEHLLFCNKDTFPLSTKSFNIILNGYFNVVRDSREGKRIWNEMENRGIYHDVYSYASIMSIYSKSGNLKGVFKLFDRMKAKGIEPDRKVYNAVIHAMAKGRLVKEACNLVKNMELMGLTPDTVTYNSLIMPLCKSRLYEEANKVFDEMLERGLVPSVRTYHAFFRILRTGDEVFELLNKMYVIGCCPSHDTYIMLIRKFSRWRQIDNVYKLWDEMGKNGLDPDRSSYIVMVHGLFLNGKLEEAYGYYQEMKGKNLLPEPRTEEMLKAWVEGKKDAEEARVMSDSNREIIKSRKNHGSDDFRRLPELRNVTRERGFALS